MKLHEKGLGISTPLASRKADLALMMIPKPVSR